MAQRWRFWAALWTGRAVSRLLRAAGRKATTLPGVVALRLFPAFFAAVGERFSGKIVLITGTNGKTTTSNLVGGWLRDNGWRVVSNRLGANLVQGLATAVVEQLPLTRREREAAVFEVDEATVEKIVEDLAPRVVVVTNFFRDQMDRYGELDRVVDLVAGALDRVPESCVCLINGDDPLAVRAAPNGKTVKFYGLEAPEWLEPAAREVREGKFCGICGHPLSYSGFFYGQLGEWGCPGCGMERPKPDPAARHIRLSGGGLVFEVDGLPAELNSPGLYNVYNVLAAYGAVRALGLSAEQVRFGMAHIRTGLGRLERFKVQDRPVVLALVKNPTGLNEQLKVVERTPDVTDVVLVLNDLYADGTDVSWIWDADLERLKEKGFERVWCAGTRAEDMAIRVRYAEWPGEIRVIRDPAACVGAALDAGRADRPGGTVYILTTYTSLYALRDWLLHRGGVEDDDPQTDDWTPLPGSARSVQ
ncbi:MAG: MurT ligase domain-containing protein [Kyrpidia sp.]|nr:MurT ligase domain-containing protein [Kyrpidia sp.]